MVGTISLIMARKPKQHLRCTMVSSHSSHAEVTGVHGFPGCHQNVKVSQMTLQHRPLVMTLALVHIK